MPTAPTDEIRTKRHTNDGLYKRCDCPRRSWLKCAHPWHFDYYKGRKFRFSLDKIARARGENPPRTKADAEALRNRLRVEIDAGTFRDLDASAAPRPTADGRLTLNDLLDAYLIDHVNIPTRRETAQKAMRWHVAMLRRIEVPAGQGTTIALGAKFADAITKADIEAVRRSRRAEAARLTILLAERRASAQKARSASPDMVPGQAEGDTRPAERFPGVKGGEAGINRLLARLRHVFSWAIDAGYVTHSPFKREGQSVVRLTSETARDRRLRPGEEELLKQHAGPHLRALLIAMLSTGCRPGELLSLQWKQVECVGNTKGEPEPRYLLLPATKTKTQETRRTPVSASLASVLAMRRNAPDGKPLGLNQFVFGNEVGERVKSVRTAWRAACRRGGIEDLHLHDLRREFGSRLLESRAPLVVVKEFLGHANISQTSTYLKASDSSKEEALRRLERYQAAAEKSSHTADDCDNRTGGSRMAAEDAELVEQ